MARSYIAIDLKSFYASVECVERGLDPLTTNLVVADLSRTEKTICLAVTPSLKAYGIGGRARLYEVVQKAKQQNIEYITAPPRMALYLEYSARIYEVYLRYIAPEDIHVYSVDEVFMDVTAYLNTYKMTPHELARKMIGEVLKETGITATAGIGTNLYLCKVAMDIVAKHMPADRDGVRIAELDEKSYRELLWDHRPLTDFWRVGRGYQKKLEANGLYTMGDIAKCSLGGPEDFYNEDLIYSLFGVNAELLIDHAWGYEPVGLAEIKSYKPSVNSICSGQVLSSPYDALKGRLIVREMVELLALDLVDKGLVTDQIVLTVGYDRENLINPEIKYKYNGPVTLDSYGREVPKHAHGTANLPGQTSSTAEIMESTLALYDEIINPNLLIRRFNISANRVVPANSKEIKSEFKQLNFFSDFMLSPEEQKKKELQEKNRQRERSMQEAMLSIKKRYGKNAILKGTNLEEGGTTIERNSQIGGHKA